MNTFKWTFTLLCCLFWQYSQAQCNFNSSIYPDTVTNTQQCQITEISAYAWPGGPFNFTWSTGVTTNATTSSLNNLSPGQLYWVTITDSIGCSVVDSFYVPISTPLSATYTVQNSSCNNSLGAIDLTTTGGSGQYYYSWSNGASTEDLSSVSAGIYSVTINDATLGCYTIIDSIVVNGANANIQATASNLICNGDLSGSIAVQLSGFTNPEVSLNGGPFGNTTSFTNLAAGTYTITARDSSCTQTTTVTITEPAPISLFVMDSSWNCSNPNLVAWVNGGAWPYTYAWSDGQTGSIASNLATSTLYTVTVADANGCTATGQATTSDSINATYTVQGATCSGFGSIDLTVSGNNNAYLFYWSNGSNNEDLTNIAPGVYSVTIYDSLTWCSHRVDSIVVGGSTLSTQITPSSCPNNTGSIELVLNGYIAPEITWSTGATSTQIDSLAPGWYGMTLIDTVLNCTYTDSFYVGLDSLCEMWIVGSVRDITNTGNCTMNGSQGLAYQQVRLQPLGITTFTNANGYYSFNVNTPGNYTVELLNSNPNHTLQCPTTSTIALNNVTYGSYLSNNNFYLTLPPRQDLKIDLYHFSTVTPGFPYYTAVIVENDGNVTQNGTISYTYDSNINFDSHRLYTYSGGTNKVSFVSHNATTRTLTFDVTGITPGERQKVYAYFTTPTTLALGTMVNTTAFITPIVGDATPVNNTDKDSTTCVGSWDPNDKRVAPHHTGDEFAGGIIFPTETELEYIIRFQNEGTAPAYKVVIRDTLSSHLLSETIRNISTSHNAQIRIENGNILIITFDNIMLPAKSVDLAGSNGYIKFTIDRNPNLALGTQIHNSAAIYFDFNAPVITNTVVSTIDQLSTQLERNADLVELEVYPNPALNQTTVQYSLNRVSDVQISVFNKLGQLVAQQQVEQVEGKQSTTIDLSQLSPGLYLISVETAEGVATKRLIKK